ncbi:Protein kinase superfamily protein [Abeliophyllum distichum]|uniref:protein-serine/threonine phosphatase n=1 Tax=Abeliophyllum distichum TaxID=126358 RepID=A0ABD1SVA2_9LAMI
MRSLVACLKRHCFSVHSTIIQNDSSVEIIMSRFVQLRGPKDLVIRRVQYNSVLSQFLHWKSFSSDYSSVHGERPSAEYAKLRKESLENEFGHVIDRSESPSMLYRFGPSLALYRAAIISFHVLKLTIWSFFVHDMKKRSIKFREILIRLGPFYIKLGQALSTRPDILPTLYCQELAKLQDQIPPFPTNVAIRSIESQLGMPISKVFADISEEPIAAASLGQVYKAHLHSGELVAVKVQRPGMSYSLTLDALLFHMIGGQLKRFAKARKDLLVAVNEMVRHMFEEIDYILEGQNAERFASLYACYSCNEERNSKDNNKANGIKVPKIYWNLTRKAVLTMEWIDGIKLTDENRLRDACLNRKQLIDEGLYCSLRQLLEVGFFHADPHPGNLVATEDGSLAYFDFGMMGDIPRHYRVGLIRVLVHFINRDSLGLANDFLSLGFLPEGVDIHAVSDALRASLGDGTRDSQDFQGIMNLLFDVMYEFNFSLPPDYALVIRALGSLEGTAKVLDPDFKVVESAYPFIIGRLLVDPSPDMRKILRQLLIRNDGSIRWNRLERLIAAISQQASETDDDLSKDRENSSNQLGWKSFNMRSVVSATEDLFQFILSHKGSRVRVFLVRDLLNAVDTFLEDDVIAFCSEENFQAATSLESEGKTKLMRVVNGLRSLRHAVKLAPDVWTAMLLRMSLKPEFQRFASTIISALAAHTCRKIPETLWCLLPLLPSGQFEEIKDQQEKVMGYLDSVLSQSTSQVHAGDAPVTGGGLSQNAKFSYGYASSPGKRSSMEDFYETRIDGVDGEVVGLFGVFDGHGGARAAEYVKQNLFSNLIRHPKFISDTKSAISDAYSHTDTEFLKSENNQHRDAGSTASTAILVGNRLVVANVGDSRAVICRGGNAFAVSRDHKPDQTDERQRIEDAGGFVMWAGTWRVGGVLAVSRAFGDRLLKQYVVADPEIKEEKVDDTLEFLILASDGLWDVVTNEEAVSMIKPIGDPEEAAKKLMQEAYERGLSFRSLLHPVEKGRRAVRG